MRQPPGLFPFKLGRPDLKGKSPGNEEEHKYEIVFEFQTSNVPRALASLSCRPVELNAVGIILEYYVMILSKHSRFKKSHSYSISYLYSNLKSPII